MSVEKIAAAVGLCVSIAAASAREPAVAPSPSGDKAPVRVASMSAAPAERFRVPGIGFNGRDAEDIFLWHATLGYDLNERARPAGRGSPLLATRPLYRAGVDDVRRPGFNGRAWNGYAIVGNQGWASGDDRSPGPEAYGAPASSNDVAYARVGPYTVAIDPFEEIRVEGQVIPREIRTRLESARQEWLKEHGYVGGVRTFVNDARKGGKAAGAIQPRATIEVPADVPKFRSRMQVNKTSPTREMPADITRISKPEVKVHKPETPGPRVVKVITSDSASQIAMK